MTKVHAATMMREIIGFSSRRPNVATLPVTSRTIWRSHVMSTVLLDKRLRAGWLQATSTPRWLSNRDCGTVM